MLLMKPTIGLHPERHTNCSICARTTANFSMIDTHTLCSVCATGF